MARRWRLQEAKSRFDEVIEEALKEGPQIIMQRGVESAVVMSYADYRTILLGRKKLSDFFREVPLAGVDLDLSRDTSPAHSDPNQPTAM